MILPLDDLLLHRWPQWGLVVAVLVGIGFGFVLERAGFGRATKLAAQFYGHDMTVLKVMFGAIVTASLGSVVAAGLGLIDLGELATHVTSWTYLGPMIAGGVLLGVGFIIAGYCPGTSVVAAASGNVDGLVTFVGVGLGCLLYAELYPLIEPFANSGNLHHLFLYDLLPVSPAVTAAAVAVLAAGAFLAADVAERTFSARYGLEVEAWRSAAGPRWITFGSFAVLAAAGLALSAGVRAGDGPAEQPSAGGGMAAAVIGQEALARRVVEEPWTLRVLDLRDREACGERRIPGAECVPLETLGELGLAYAPPDVDLVLVAEGPLDQVPPAAREFRGDVFVLDGGFTGWERFALTAPDPPDAPAGSPLWQRYRIRSGIYSALTGVQQAPPPPAPTATFVPPPPSGGGGCG